MGAKYGAVYSDWYIDCKKCARTDRLDGGGPKELGGSQSQAERDAKSKGWYVNPDVCPDCKEKK